MLKVLILDDEPITLSFLENLLGADPRYDVILCSSLHEFCELNKEEQPDLFIVDLLLLNGDIFSVTDEFDTRHAILMTGYLTNDVKHKAKSLSFGGVLSKPVKGKVLKNLLDTLAFDLINKKRDHSYEKALKIIPKLFELLGTQVVTVESIQSCLELIGEKLNVNLIVAPQSSTSRILFPLFHYCTSNHELNDWPTGILPDLILRPLQDRTSVYLNVEEFDSDFQDFFKTIGLKAERILAFPIFSKKLGDWGYVLFIQQSGQEEFSKEVLLLIKCLVSILTMGLNKLVDTHKLTQALENAIQIYSSL